MKKKIMKYEKSPKRKPIEMHKHKAFGIAEISVHIVSLLPEQRIEKYMNEQKYHETEKRSAKYRRMSQVSKHWNTLFSREKIIAEYNEGGLRSMNFCTICDRYEPNIYENSPSHQNHWHRINERKEAEIELSYKKVTWKCKLGCTVHCLREPGHCKNGRIAGYEQKDVVGYWRWREKQIKLCHTGRLIIAERYIKNMYLKERNVTKRLRQIKNGKKGETTVKFEFRK
jgi:hypothetical protein